MTENEIIIKAKNALDKLNISYDKDYSNVIHIEDEMLLELDEKMKDEYTVIFRVSLPNHRKPLIAVHVDKKTNELLYVTTKHDHISIPDDLK